MKNHDSYDTRLRRQQRQFYHDWNLGGSHFQQQHRELRRRRPEQRHQPDVLHDVDQDAEWAEYCDESWLP
jgi:hypothetical protein